MKGEFILPLQPATDDELFESVLRELSPGAFRAVINAGVRDINDFLAMDTSALADVSRRIKAELSAVQRQLCRCLYGNYLYGAVASDSVPEPRSNAVNAQPTATNGDHLLQVILGCLGVRAQHALAYGQVSSLEQFMHLTEDVMARWRNTGKKTIAEILDVQKQVREGIAHLETLDANSLHEYLEQTTGVVSRYALQKPIRNLWTSPGALQQSLKAVVQRSAREPAEWSVLRKTIPDVFWVEENDLEALWASAEEQLVEDAIDLPRADWERLAAAAIYKNDRFDVLLAVTLGYLLELQISSQAFDEIVDSVISLINAGEHVGQRLPPLKVSDEPIVTRADISGIEGFRIDSFDLPEDCIKEIDVRGVCSWRDLVNLTEKKILESHRLSLEALCWIRKIWKMRFYAQTATQKLSWLPLESRSSFRSMVEYLVESIARNDRERTIALGMLGLLNGRKVTFEELGDSLGLTRERVRQIWLKMTNRLRSPKLDRFWLAVFETLKLSGGVCLLAELAEGIRQRLGWEQAPEEVPVSSLLRLRDDIEIDNHQSLVSNPKSECINCKTVSSAMSRLFETDKDEKTVAKVAECLLSICRQQTECSDRCGYLSFSEGFIRVVAGKTQDVMVEEGIVYHRETWSGRRGSSVQIVENILKSAGRAMHFSEVCEEVKRLHPSKERVTEHNVHSWLDRSPRLLRWDRGTFIHRDFVVMPETLLIEIGSWLWKKLETGIPFFSVAGAWAEFEDRLRAEGIPSETALYFCLRELSYPRLVFPRYPYVMTDLPEVERLPVSIALEQFILESGGLVSTQDVKAYAVNELGMSEQMFPTHLSNAPNVVRGGRGSYIHINNLKLDFGKLEPILEYVKALVAVEGHVSVKKIFSDKQVSCLAMGIKTPQMLYDLLQFYADGNIELPRYPRILAAGYQNANGGRRGVVNEVVDYIARIRRVCSFDELEQHFVEKLGYDAGTIYNAIFHANVVRYGRGSVVHLDTLEWTNEKQHSLEAEAQEVLSLARKAGRCYGLIDDVIDVIEYRQLPELANRVVWTRTLVAGLLVRGGRFKVVGSAQNVFVSVPNDEGIESFEDLAYELLGKKYNGACELEQFEHYLRESGIIQKGVTTRMLGNQDKVCIVDKIIMLKELRQGIVRTCLGT